MTYFPVLSEAFGFGYDIGREIARLFVRDVNNLAGSEVLEPVSEQPYSGGFTEAPASTTARDTMLVMAALVVAGIYFFRGGKLNG